MNPLFALLTTGLGFVCALVLTRGVETPTTQAALDQVPLVTTAASPSAQPAPVISPMLVEVLEARDASLFAGACHLASEACSQGRKALIAMSFEQGNFEGVGLAGVRAVVSVSAKDNLSTPAERRSELWVDGSPEQATALAAWLVKERPAAVGQLLATHQSQITFERSGASFRIDVPGLVQLVGEAITDGSCCSMPEFRLYEPLVTQTEETVVGLATTCEFQGTELLSRWSHTDANNVHVGRFEAGN